MQNLFESTHSEKKKMGSVLEVTIRSQFSFAFQASALRKFRQVLQSTREVLNAAEVGKAEISRFDHFEENVEYSPNSLDVEGIQEELAYFIKVVKKLPKTPQSKAVIEDLTRFEDTFNDAVAGRF